MICNYSDLSQEQLDSLKSLHQSEYFPGLSIPLPEVVSMMAATDPASAIMAQAINDEGVDDSMAQSHRLLFSDQTGGGRNKLDKFLNPKQRTVFNETLDNLILKYKKAFKDLDLEKSYEGLFQLLWHSTSPCFDIQNWTSSYRDQRSSIKQCMWKGVNVIKLYFLATN